MGKINMGRVILGGVLAGVFLFCAEFVLQGVILSAAWKEAMSALGKSSSPASMGGAMMLYALWSLILGIASVWLYAAMRPRFGAGVGTAVKAGLAVWVFSSLGPTIVMSAMDLFHGQVLTVPVIGELVIYVVAVVLGAWPYQEAV